MPSHFAQFNDILDAVFASASADALVNAEDLIDAAHNSGSLTFLQYVTLRARVNTILDAWNVPA